MTDAIQKQTEPEPVRIVTTSEDCAACSKSSDFLDVLITQAVGSQAISFVVEKDRGKYANAAASALMGIRPQGELEGMLAAQLVASHNVAMECYRRAGNTQTIKVRDYNLNQANKCSRTFVTLLRGIEQTPRQGSAEGHR